MPEKSHRNQTRKQLEVERKCGIGDGERKICAGKSFGMCGVTPKLQGALEFCEIPGKCGIGNSKLTLWEIHVWELCRALEFLAICVWKSLECSPGPHGPSEHQELWAGDGILGKSSWNFRNMGGGEKGWHRTGQVAQTGRAQPGGAGVPC